MKKKKKISTGQIVLNIFFILLCICYVYPLLVLIAASFEGASNPQFSLKIQEFTLDAYKQVFANSNKMLKGYAVTIFYSVVGTFGSLAVMALFAYAISKRDFKYRNVLTFMLFFSTLFNGGLVPTYLVVSKLLHLNNTIWVYILPSLLNTWNVIVLRTFFQGLPASLYEAARIDGASEFRVCFQIAIPLATPALASVGFLAFITYWNEWYVTSIYIRDPDLYSLQYILKIVLDDAEYLKEMMANGAVAGLEKSLKNLESLRFAMAVASAGPMLFVFPFFQKYFAKGLTIGSVKG